MLSRRRRRTVTSCDTTAGSRPKRRRLLFTEDVYEMFMTRSLNVTPNTTEQHLIARSDKSVACVTNNKRLQCAPRFVLLKPTTDRHESSRGLFATAELLVRADDKVLIKSLYQLIGYNARQFVLEFSSKGWTRRSLNRLLKDAGSRHHRLEAASHRYTWKHSAEHHRQGR